MFKNPLERKLKLFLSHIKGKPLAFQDKETSSPYPWKRQEGYHPSDPEDQSSAKLEEDFKEVVHQMMETAKEVVLLHHEGDPRFRIVPGGLMTITEEVSLNLSPAPKPPGPSIPRILSFISTIFQSLMETAPRLSII